MSNQNELTHGELEAWLVQLEKNNAEINAKIQELNNHNAQWEKICVLIGVTIGIPLGYIIENIIDVILK